MVLWNFDLLWKNYSTMKKTLGYYNENFGILIYYGKTMVLWKD